MSTSLAVVPVERGQHEEMRSLSIQPLQSMGVPSTLDEVVRIGKIMSASGFFSDSRDVAQACAKVLAGRELGIGPLASMTGLHIIKGKVTLSANLIAGQIRRSGRYSYRVVKLDASECHLEFYEAGRKIGESRLTMADAKARGLDIDEASGKPKGPWQKFPENMLFARAMSNGARWYCPDVFSGPVYTPEEMGAVVDADGEMLALPPMPQEVVAAQVPAPSGAVEEAHTAAVPETVSGEGDAEYQQLRADIHKHLQRLGLTKKANAPVFAALQAALAPDVAPGELAPRATLKAFLARLAKFRDYDAVAQFVADHSEGVHAPQPEATHISEEKQVTVFPEDEIGMFAPERTVEADAGQSGLFGEGDE